MDTRNLLDPITPGEILKEDFLGSLKISINQLARNIGVPPNRISEIVNWSMIFVWPDEENGQLLKNR